MLPPFTFDPNKSIEVYEQTKEFLSQNTEVNDRIQELSWLYHSLLNVIPTTTENFWSGHHFPYCESWDELQVSFNLICFGLYKQAMASLRSGLEIGLLSVYYNINDDGHIAVKKWLNSADTREADTPRITDIWKILVKNDNIKRFQEEFNIKDRLLKLGYLHNYVHTKGFHYSNRIGKFKSNFQTFEEEYVRKWLETFEEIIIIVMTLHLLKYPAGIIRYDYSAKFGIDAPFFSHLREHEIDRLNKYLPEGYIQLLEKIASNDPETKSFLEWVKSHPDMTKEDVENQIIEMDKMHIERQGIEDYKRQQLVIYRSKAFEQLPDKVRSRIQKLESWAIENDFIEPKWKNNKTGNDV